MNSPGSICEAFNRSEPIPGYIAKEMIGSGGYGEVWKVYAPGGLLKAIKIVHGEANAKRAVQELRSINRIKDVRHPFLISIERIEIIGGSVVIVTELADQNLKQLFNHRVALGHPGIERGELLKYLGDSAEALDYIYDNYALQHLDVKPENLLLVGNRVKVADFGLVKHLYDRSASRIEGLTPIYAPPELFEGQPHRHSDQYSLAIVYQQMLTGETPFDGTTAARLAAQHLNQPPTLSALPKRDQPIIARALSKDPAKRFEGCCAFVEALVEAEKHDRLARLSSAASNQENAGRSLLSDVKPTTTPAADPTATGGTVSLSQPAIEAGAKTPLKASHSKNAAKLPPLEFNREEVSEYGPIMFVGIGGLATRVFRQLRRRFHDRLGTNETIPAIEFLLLDTDIQSLNLAARSAGGLELQAGEMLPMPLRPSEAYRSLAGNVLESISRRWLYNIPYSLQTEGLRPLGRLALVDHSRRLLERIRQAASTITDEKSIAATAQHTGLKFVARPPRVFVVASISGGTGSGMVLDVAYATRFVLTELGLSDEHVHGILMHGEPRGSGDRDKAIANAYAALNELWNFSRPGQCYPGDRGCKVPAFHGNNRTFASCYLVHLGDRLTEQKLDAATDPIAEYLYCSSVTPAARVLERCRLLEQAQCDHSSTEPTLRTFGLAKLGGSSTDIPTLMADLLCQDLIRGWRTGSTPTIVHRTLGLNETAALIAAHSKGKVGRFPELDEQAAAKAQALRLDFESLCGAAQEMLEQEIESDLDSFLQNLVGESLKASSAHAESEQVVQVIDTLDSVLSDNVRGDDDTNDFDSLATVLSIRLGGGATKLSSAVVDWILGLMDTSTGRVEGAKYGAEWFQTHLQSLEGQVNATAMHQREQALAQKDVLLSTLTKAHSPGAGRRVEAKLQRELQTGLLEYARRRVEHIISGAVARCLGQIIAPVNATMDSLREFWTELNSLEAIFAATAPPEESDDSSPADASSENHARATIRSLLERRPKLTEVLDRFLEDQIDVRSAKLRYLLTKGPDIRSELVVTLRTAARKVIVAAMDGLSLSRLAHTSREAKGDKSGDLQRCIELARPLLQEGTAASRLLVIVPDNMNQTQFSQGLAADVPTATVIPTTQCDLIVCQEVENLEVRRVAARIVEGRRDYVDIAKRLHTRVDVTWAEMPLS
ncbi:MAG TPA: tubulin-like doman-containing protein [Pirellulales bacterium]|nr:tubulin-like doman-containing protein [Pirellulales bacterium]